MKNMSFEELICYIRDNIFGEDIEYPPIMNFIFGKKNEEILFIFGENIDEVPIVISRETCLNNKDDVDTVVCAKIRSELLRNDMDAWQVKRANKIISLINQHPEAFNNFFDNF